LSGRDIYRSCRHIIEKDDSFCRVRNIYLTLVDKIVAMAEGVFLWAILTVKSLLVEAGRHASSNRLMQKLRDMPPELEMLYDEMLKGLSREDRRFIDYLLLVVITKPKSL